MYLEHFGLAEPPFRITPNTDFFYTGARRGAMLDGLIYAITHDEGIVRITGEVGSGKTMLCRVLIEHLPPMVDTVYLATPSLSRDDILYAIVSDLGLAVPPEARHSAVLRLLQEDLLKRHEEGRKVVVLIDEAHAMPAETLEEIRLLSNLESKRHKLLQLVLFGQPELNDVLARPDLRQLKERITQNFTLEPLVRQDIAQYLDFRMRAAGYHGPDIFSSEATRLIARASRGLTRRVNILADKALLAAYAQGRHEVTAKEARLAIRDSQFARIKASLVSWRGLALSAMALLVIVLLYFAYSTVRTAYEQASQEVAAAAAAAAAPPAAGPLAQQRLAAGQAWFAAAKNTHWSVQLISADAGSASEVAQVETLLARTAGVLDGGRIKVFTAANGRLVVAFGEFSTRSKAAAAADLMAERFAAEPRRVGAWRVRNQGTGIGNQEGP